MLVGLFLCCSITITELLQSELLKSEKVLEATLDDDLSAMFLTLRKNGRFELVSDNMFGSKTFDGNYKVRGNMIIFLSKPYENDFIPDTIKVAEGKLVWNFDSSGKPVISFANYFTIKTNKLEAAIH